MPSDGRADAAIQPDISRDVSLQLYSDAVRQYTQNVAPRALALYQVGNVSFPGLSDVDLLLIPDKSRVDNGQYFSAYERLRPSYLKVFLHEPFVLPGHMLDLIAHTSHSKRALLSGADLLGNRSPTDRTAERWCKLFESYCNYRLFVDNVTGQRVTSGRLLVAVASSMRYALNDLDTLAGTVLSSAYSASVDDLRRRILSENESAPLLHSVWIVFLGALHSIEAKVGELLSVRSDTLVTFGRTFLAGKQSVAGVDMDFVTDRRRSIDAYYAELRRLRLPFGSLFYAAAYDSPALRYRQPFTIKLLCKSYYRVRFALSK